MIPNPRLFPKKYLVHKERKISANRASLLLLLPPSEIQPTKLNHWPTHVRQTGKVLCPIQAPSVKHPRMHEICSSFVEHHDISWVAQTAYGKASALWDAASLCSANDDQEFKMAGVWILGLIQSMCS